MMKQKKKWGVTDINEEFTKVYFEEMNSKDKKYFSKGHQFHLVTVEERMTKHDLFV